MASDEGKSLTIPKDAAQIMRDKVRTMFVELIPEGKLDEMIQAEWSHFFETHAEARRSPSWGYGSRPKPDEAQWSPFELMTRRIIREQMEEHVKAQVKEAVDKIAWGQHDEDGAAILSKIVKECSADIWETAMAKMVTEAASIIQNNLQNMLQNRQY